jgi:hypothetical protein
MYPYQELSQPERPTPAQDAQEEPRPKEALCVHGIFRSGTNFFRALMESNFDCRISYDEFGWKHAFFPIVTRYSPVVVPDTPSVLLTKNPLSALSSLYSYARSNPKNIRSAAAQDFRSFLRRPVVIFDGSNQYSAEYRFVSAVEYWNSMNWNLHSIVRKRPDATHIRYEDLLAGPERALTPLAERHGLKRTTVDFIIPSKRMNNLPDQQHNQEKFFSNRNYVAEDYLASFEEDDLRFVARHLCLPLVRKLGYMDVYEKHLAPLTIRKPSHGG